MRQALETTYAAYPNAILVHGDCPDGDRQAAGIWRGLGGECEAHPADWEEHGRAAGPIRNQRMVESGINACLAFIRNGSRGASHCAALAEDAGIPTVRYTYEEGL
jgi:hypothetical protein